MQALLDKAERGSYSINSVGDNLVAITLPGDGTVGAQTRRKPVKKVLSTKTVNKKVPKKTANKAPAKTATSKKK